MRVNRNASHSLLSTLTLSVLTLAVAMLSLFSAGACGASTDQPTPGQKLWAAYWTVQPGFMSTLEMKNNLVQMPLNVGVSLYFASGEEYPLAPITLGPRQTAVLDINRIIALLPASTRARAGTEGTVEVDFNAPTPSSLMGSVSVANANRGTAWNFFLYAQRPDPTPLPLRGVFWFADDQCDGFIALQNISDAPVLVSPRLEISSHSYPVPTVSLASGQGFKFELRKELNKLGLKDATAGGIEFTYQGNPDALKAHGALFDDRGFSAEIDFIRYDSTTDSGTFSLRTPRFAIGRADPILGLPAQAKFEPVVALHNFESNPLNVALLVGYMQGDTQQTVKVPLSVPAGDTSLVSLHPYLKGVPVDVPWASLQLSYTAQQASLTAAMVSVSQDGEHSIRSVLNWVEGSNREGWYWRADAQQNTLVSILNTDSEDARVAISLDYYHDGVAHSFILPERTLAAGATSTVDIGEVIVAGKPDANGDYFPLGVTFGGYHVRKIGQHIDKTITTEALVLDRRNKTFTTFYNTCCGIAGAPTFSPNQFLGPIGPLGNFLNQGTDYCSGQTIDMTPSSTFSSANAAVATVSTAGAVSGVATGATNSNSFLSFSQQKTVDTCVRKSTSAQKPTTVTHTAQISSVTLEHPTINLHTAPTTSNITVQIFHTDLTSVGAQTVEVTVGTYSSNPPPPSLSVTYNPATTTVTLSGAQGVTTATLGVSSQAGSGTVVIQATLSNPSSGISIVAPSPASNAQATLTITPN
jgi:hypothetical protein